MDIRHQQDAKGGNFYYEQDGRKMAAMVYIMANEHTMIIEHTEVDDSLGGKGVGKQLLAALVDYVRKNDIKVIPLCPFAKAMLAKITDWQDILKQPLNK